jgi:hypothetical protein
LTRDIWAEVTPFVETGVKALFAVRWDFLGGRELIVEPEFEYLGLWIRGDGLALSHVSE